MNPPNHPRFLPLHDAALLIQTDRNALAHQLRLCHTDQSAWHRFNASAQAAQAFTAQHLVSTLLLAAATCLSLTWLIR